MGLWCKILYACKYGILSLEVFIHMKKKKVLKKVIVIGIVLALIAGVVALVLSSGDDAEEIKLADIPVISFFGITGDTTTEADIIAVERDLNNVLITEGYAVKLFLAPEERFDTMVSSAMEMMDAYMENNKKKADEKYGFEYKFDYKTSTFDFKCDESAVTPSVVYNQDTIIELLDAGTEIYPNVPSIDVLLVRDYDKYYDLAGEGAFERLNGSLSDVAKALNQSIPAAFFEAVKINNSDIFGVPSVQMVGEYEYLVFDKDMLDKYEVSSKQLVTVDDLDGYLKTVAADEENTAIPLLNAPVSSPIELLEGNSLGITTEGAILFAYDETHFTEYYATIARYRSLGLMGEVGADIEKSDFAVAFFRGTEAEVKALSEKTGKNLTYNVFSKPLATSAEVGEAVFCVCSTKLYSVNDAKLGIDFVTLLNRPQSQTDIKNILLYGALGINYNISDVDGTVIYANDNTYTMDNLYTGHTLHALASSDKGVSKEWIEMVQKHNLDLGVSKLSGFKFAPKVYNFENNKGESVKITGPDYLAIIDSVCNEIYTDYINGVSCAVDIEEFNGKVDELIRERIKKNIKSEYETLKDAELSVTIEEEVRADEAFMTPKREEASSTANALIKETVKAQLESEFRASYKNLGVTDETEIQKRLAKDVTDEVIQQRIDRDYTEEDINVEIEATLTKFVSSEVTVRLGNYKRTDEYINMVNAYVASAEFSARVEEEFEANRDTQYFVHLDEAIADNVYNFGEELKEKIAKAYEEAVAAFLESQKADIPAAELEDATIFVTFDDVLINMFQNQYYGLKGEPKA